MEQFEQMARQGQPPYYRRDLDALLRELGVDAGDKLILHASLKSFGYLIGGAATVIDAVLGCIGPAGTLVLPAQSVNGIDPKLWQYPPAPAEWHEAIRASMLPYDPAKTPVDDALGEVARYFSRYPGVCRSGHPLYSFCAVGRDAQELMKDHPLDYGLGPRSPLQKLYDADAKILLLGATFEHNTSLHLAEYAAGRPDIEESAKLWVDGAARWISFKNIDLDIYDDFLEVQAGFLASHAGQVRRAALPKGEALCCSMRACVDYAAAHYRAKG